MWRTRVTRVTESGNGGRSGHSAVSIDAGVDSSQSGCGWAVTSTAGGLHFNRLAPAAERKPRQIARTAVFGTYALQSQTEHGPVSMHSHCMLNGPNAAE